MDNNKQLSNKKGIFVNMREYYKLVGIDPFEVLPLTFLVKNGITDSEFVRFEEYYSILGEKVRQNDRIRNQLIQKRIQQIYDE